MTPDCIAQIDFDSVEVLNKINRKTEFSLVEEQLKGKRPAGLLSITFDTKVQVLEQRANKPGSISIEQSLYNYNMFVDEAAFAYQLQPISETEVLVDVQASNTVRPSVPGWVNNLFQSNVDDKVLHFQAALTALCSNWKKPSES
ncbi:hypothetical protein VSU01S_03430 [Vibrio superstes NBRC 103154]|uniref:Polyketide cyclase n=2 Tax=Vibrio superstes TaxID=198815 RepID=A0A511QL91_9VIBR|nr:hypothetical protein VSU01S_03430 [Vibrio superstes NBRC 103154]